MRLQAENVVSPNLLVASTMSAVVKPPSFLPPKNGDYANVAAQKSSVSGWVLVLHSCVGSEVALMYL